MNPCLVFPRRSAAWPALAALALGASVSPGTRAGADDAQNIFHFTGPGKICSQIISLVEKDGGRVDWGTNNLIAYDARTTRIVFKPGS